MKSSAGCLLFVATLVLSGNVAGRSLSVVTETPQTDQTVKPLLHAHAHNDYYHPRPLLDALDHGFTSIEADVFLRDGTLLVAHSVSELSAEKTLEKLYLKPLLQRVADNGGRVYQNGPAVILLVDIKSDGAAAYTALHALLARYADMISVTQNGQFEERAVTVIVSGDRAADLISASTPRYAGIDGRLGDLDSELPVSLLPLISDNWNNHFRYRGDGVMSDRERAKLKQVVAAAHAKGRRVRFWATAEQPALWQELRSAGVDLIGTDDLKRLSQFLREESDR